MNNNFLEENLFRLWTKGQLAHFYILQASTNEDDPRSFLRQWTNNFIATLIAKEKQTDKDCAIKTIENGHADILVIENENPGKNYSIKDDTFNEFFKFQNFKNFELKQRFIIIEDAHAITKVLSNKLLKTLEEPAANTTILLLDPFRQEILPTIASRGIFLKLPSKNASRDINKVESFSAHLASKQIDETLINSFKSFEQNPEHLSPILDYLKANKEDEFNIVQEMSSYMSENSTNFEKLNTFLDALNWYEKAKTFNNHSPEKLIGLLRCVIN